MRVARYFLLSLFVLATSASAQSPADEALRDFDFVVDSLRTDYAGFPDKTAGDKLATFEADVVRYRALVAEHPDKLFDTMWDLLGWFKDGHLAFDSGPSQPPPAPPSADEAAKERTLAETGRFVPIEEGTAKKIKALRVPQGIWETLDGTYRVAVVPDPENRTQFVGIILASLAPSWTPGQVKFNLSQSPDGKWQSTFRFRNHDEKQGEARFQAKASLMEFDSISSLWKRIWPEPAVTIDRIVPSKDFFLRALSPETLWLRLPNFKNGNRETIEKLLSENSQKLATTPNLLIDLRNNSGGSDASYAELMKWICSRSIYSIGVEFRVSKRNADLYETLANAPDFPESFRPMINSLVSNMRVQPTAKWATTGERPFSIQTCPDIRANPRRVAIIITGAGSSGDQFVLDARQSRKVTTFGGNSAGIIDYSNQLQTLTPSGKYLFKWSSSRSMRLPDEPIDGVGIAPDIRVAAETDDPVGYVQQWLEKQVG